MNTNTEGQGQLEVLVLDVGEYPVHLHVVHVKPLLGVVLGGEELEQLQCCDPGLLTNQRLAFCCVNQSQVSITCLLLDTNIKTGLVGLCCLIPWNAGLFMVAILVNDHK